MFFLCNTADNRSVMKKFKIFASLPFTGVIAGIVNGFLGSGGGIIILNGMLKNGVEKRKAHASCVLAVLPLSVVSAFFYGGYLPEDSFEILPLLIGCGIGGVAGALFLAGINKTVLELVFDGIILYSGIRMLIV